MLEMLSASSAKKYGFTEAAAKNVLRSQSWKSIAALKKCATLRLAPDAAHGNCVGRLCWPSFCIGANSDMFAPMQKAALALHFLSNETVAHG